MEKESVQDNEFEYNDGLGDMLREKEGHEFSWAKTTILIISIIAIIIVFFILSFNLGKKILNRKEQISRSDRINKEEIAARLSAIEEEETSLMESSPIEEVVPVSEPEVKKPKIFIEETTISVETPATDLAEEIVLDGAKKVRGQTTPIIMPKKAPSPDNGMNTPFKVIVGSFSEYKNAKDFSKILKKKGISSYIWIYRNSGMKYYRIQVGAFSKYNEAQNFVKYLNNINISGYVLKK
ncbi:SPOR domain-containing protein [Candidatus Margulisiibacteriota bacterium]